MIYYIVFVLLLALSYVYDFHTNQKGKSLSFWLVCIIMTAIAGFRFRLGIDTINYMEDFEENARYLSNFFEAWRLDELPYEIGFALFESLCKSICDSWFFFQFVIAFFVNFSIFRFVHRNARYPFVVILLYFAILYFDINYETLRQSMSLSFALWAYEYLKQKSYARYMILSICAVLMHNVGIVLFLLPLLQIKRYNYKVLCAVCIIIFVSGGVFNQMFPYLADIFHKVGFENMAEKAVTYTEADGLGTESVVNRSLRHLLFRFVLYVCPMLVLCYLIWITSAERWQFYMSPFLYVWAISICLLSFIPISYRLYQYVAIFVFLQISEAIVEIINGRIFAKNMFLLFSMVCIIGYWNYAKFYTIANGIHTEPRIVSYSPYASIFTEEINSSREQFYREVR